MDYIGNELEIFKIAHNWKSYYSSFFKKYLKGDVLEIGAGIGETTHTLCDGTQNSWICVEPDAVLSKEIAAKKLSCYLPDMIEIITGFIEDVDKVLLFDAIIYIDVIEHIERDAEELNKAVARLKPGGKLIILVPAHNFLMTKFDRAIGHYRRYDKKMLDSVVPKDVEKLKLIYLDSVGLTASLANKFLLKQSYPKIKQIKFWDSVMIPLSRISDWLLLHSMGKSVLGIWKKPI